MITQYFNDFATILKVLAQPRRLEIIMLLRHQDVCVSDINEMLDFPQVNISQHLKVLKSAGLVTVIKKGKFRYYHLADALIVKACDQLRQFLVKTNPKYQKQVELNTSIAQLLPLAHDPVCRMQLSQKFCEYTHEYNKKTYFFCASGCLKKFQKSPQTYVQ